MLLVHPHRSGLTVKSPLVRCTKKVFGRSLPTAHLLSLGLPAGPRCRAARVKKPSRGSSEPQQPSFPTLPKSSGAEHLPSPLSGVRARTTTHVRVLPQATTPQQCGALHPRRRHIILVQSDLKQSSFSNTQHNGVLPEDYEGILQGRVQISPGPQGDSVQGRQGLQLRPGQAAVRPQAVWIRWTDQAGLPQEGKDDQEGHGPPRVQEVQG